MVLLNSNTKKFKVMNKFFLISILLLAFVSCEKEEFLPIKEESNLTESTTLIVNGIETVVAADPDGNIDFSKLDADVRNTLETAHFLQFRDKIYLFEDKKMLDQYISKIVASQSHSNTFKSKIEAKAYYEVYEHDNYRGASLKRSNAFSISNLRNYNLDDKITSAIVVNYTDELYIVQLYKHKNFEGKVLNLIVEPKKASGISKITSKFGNVGDNVSSIKAYFL